MHRSENPIYAFPEMKLRGLFFNSFIHVSGCNKIGRTVLGNLNPSQIHEGGNWEREQFNSCFGNNWAAQFHFWDYINRHQTFTYIGFSQALHLRCGEEGGGVGTNGMRRRVGKKRGDGNKEKVMGSRGESRKGGVREWGRERRAESRVLSCRLPVTNLPYSPMTRA